MFHELSANEAKIVAYFTDEWDFIFIFLFFYILFIYFVITILMVTMDIFVNCKVNPCEKEVHFSIFLTEISVDLLIMEIISNIATIK